MLVLLPLLSVMGAAEVVETSSISMSIVSLVCQASLLASRDMRPGSADKFDCYTVLKQLKQYAQHQAYVPRGQTTHTGGCAAPTSFSCCCCNASQVRAAQRIVQEGAAG